MSDSHILVIGAASIDVKGRAKGPLVPGTSNPGTIRISVGGVARNVAENLARLGMDTVLLSAVGDDDFGRQILERTAAGGVDVSHVITSAEHRSGAYLALLDEEGLLHISLDDTAVIERVTPRYLYDRRRLFKEAAMVVMDANLTPRAIRSAVSLARKAGVPICVDPTSVSLAPRLIPHLAALSIVTPNLAEAGVFCECQIAGRRQAVGAAQQLVAAGVETAIVTLGPEGLCYATSTESGYVPAIEVEVVDYTGAGDALTAGVVFGLLNDFPLDEAVRLGVSAATLTIQSRETVRPDLSLELLYERLVI